MTSGGRSSGAQQQRTALTTRKRKILKRQGEGKLSKTNLNSVWLPLELQIILIFMLLQSWMINFCNCNLRILNRIQIHLPKFQRHCKSMACKGVTSCCYAPFQTRHTHTLHFTSLRYCTTPPPSQQPRIQIHIPPRTKVPYTSLPAPAPMSPESLPYCT